MKICYTIIKMQFVLALLLMVQQFTIVSCRPRLKVDEQPSSSPSTFPSERPTLRPSIRPSINPFEQPTSVPSWQPTAPSSVPSWSPTSGPTNQPSDIPSFAPTFTPTYGFYYSLGASDDSFRHQSLLTDDSFRHFQSHSGTRRRERCHHRRRRVKTDAVCPEGCYNYQNSYLCYRVPLGSVLPRGSDTPLVCPVNTYANSQRDTCLNCPDGYVAPQGSFHHSQCVYVTDDIITWSIVSLFLVLLILRRHGFRNAIQKRRRVLKIFTNNMRQVNAALCEFADELTSTSPLVCCKSIKSRVVSGMVEIVDVCCLTFCSMALHVIRLLGMVFLMHAGYGNYANLRPLTTQFIQLAEQTIFFPTKLAVSLAVIFDTIRVNVSTISLTCSGIASSLRLLISVFVVGCCVLVASVEYEHVWRDVGNVLRTIEYLHFIPSFWKKCVNDVRSLRDVLSFMEKALVNLIAEVTSVILLWMPKPSWLILYALTTVSLNFFTFQYSEICNSGSYYLMDQTITYTTAILCILSINTVALAFALCVNPIRTAKDVIVPQQRSLFSALMNPDLACMIYVNAIVTRIGMWYTPIRTNNILSDPACAVEENTLSVFESASMIVDEIIPSREDLTGFYRVVYNTMRVGTFVNVMLCGPLYIFISTLCQHLWMHVLRTYVALLFVALGQLNSMVGKTFSIQSSSPDESSSQRSKERLYSVALEQDKNLRAYSSRMAPWLAFWQIFPGGTLMAITSVYIFRTPLFIGEDLSDKFPPMICWGRELAADYLDNLRIPVTGWTLWWMQVHLLVVRSRLIRLLDSGVMVFLVVLMTVDMLTTDTVHAAIAWWGLLGACRSIVNVLQRTYPIVEPVSVHGIEFSFVNPTIVVV